MELLEAAYRLIFNIITPVIIILSVVGIFAGALRVATQIEDRSLGFALRFILVFGLVYFLADNWGGSLLEFTKQIWGNIEYYKPIICILP